MRNVLFIGAGLLLMAGTAFLLVTGCEKDGDTDPYAEGDITLDNDFQSADRPAVQTTEFTEFDPIHRFASVTTQGADASRVRWSLH